MYELIIIGGGPAGYAAAIRAAELGGRVLLVEAGRVGGTCLHRGCVPAKVLYRCAAAVEASREAYSGGLLAGSARVMPGVVDERRLKVVSGLHQGLLQLLKGRGVHIMEGRATLLDRGLVLVRSQDETREIRAKSIIIATGSQESKPSFPGASLVRSVEESLSPPDKLCRVVIIGGGNTGLELASAYALLGFTVTVLEKEHRLLPALDDDECGKWLGFLLRRRGVTVYTGAVVSEVRHVYRNTRVIINTSGGFEKIEADLVIAAAGRVPNLSALENAPVALELNEYGGIRVNKCLETGLAGVFAAGDVTGPPMLAHLAYAEGMAAAENAMGQSRTVDYRAVPYFLSALPEVAWVGLTENQARQVGLRTLTGMFPFAANGCAQVEGRTEGFVKIVALKDEGTIIGMQVLGGRAAEMIMEGVLAVKNRLHFSELAGAIHPHPTYSEGVWEAALSLGGSWLHGPARRK